MATFEPSKVSLPEGSKFIRKSVKNADLAKAVFSSVWIGKCSFVSTMFTKAHFTNATDHGNSFLSCSFTKADLSGAVIGYDGSQYRKCMFNECNFTRAGFIRAEFTDCVFVNCKLKGNDFGASSFERCSFKGLLDDVWFRGDYGIPADRERFGVPKQNTMIEVSFKDAELRRLTFSDACPLDQVILPAAGRYLLVSDWKRRLLALHTQASLTSGPTGRELELFAKVHLVHAEHQSFYILNYQDIEEDFGKKAADLIFLALS